MIRSRQCPWGFPWLSNKHAQDAELGNALVIFMLDVLGVLEAHPVSRAGYVVLVFGEHPEDLGTARREEDGMYMDPASIWQLERMRAVVASTSVLQLFTVVFNQCCWGAPYRKPTRLIANLPQLRSWGACSRPQFDAHRHYVGPQLSCQRKPSVTLARSSTDAGFRTTTTSAYPVAMDNALAEALFFQLQSAPLHAKEGEGDGVEPEPQKEREDRLKPKKRVLEVDKKEEDKQRLPPKKKARAEKEGLESGAKPGARPPLQVSYKGETRALHDGAGLCSPGRWPVSKRRLPKTERETATVSWFAEAFEGWLRVVGEDKAKEIFWSMAAGKLRESPFEEGMAEARRSLDEHLVRWGLDPSRRSGRFAITISRLFPQDTLLLIPFTSAYPTLRTP